LPFSEFHELWWIDWQIRALGRQPRYASYSITSSARSRNASGIAMPRAFAVVRLTTSSKVVGCSTGRSAAAFVQRLRELGWVISTEPATLIGLNRYREHCCWRGMSALESKASPSSIDGCQPNFRHAALATETARRRDLSLRARRRSCRYVQRRLLALRACTPTAFGTCQSRERRHELDQV